MQASSGFPRELFGSSARSMALVPLWTPTHSAFKSGCTGISSLVPISSRPSPCFLPRPHFLPPSSHFPPIPIPFVFPVLPGGAWLEFPGSKRALVTTSDAESRGGLPNRLLLSAVHALGFPVSPVILSNRCCSVLHVKLSSSFPGSAPPPPDAGGVLGCPSSRVERVLFLGKVWT